MTILNEFESKKLLEENGINIVKGKILDVDHYRINVQNIVDSIGVSKYVIKIISPDIIHKSSCGGVITDVWYYDVEEEIEFMRETIHQKLPNAKIEGFYIQEMAESGIECIIGIKNDPQFGRVVIFGFGGIYTEVFNDISMRILPITPADAWKMITETKIYKILKGARGKQYDINSIVDSIIKVSQMSDNLNIKELDINPLIVHEKGCIAVDARIML